MPREWTQDEIDAMDGIGDDADDCDDETDNEMDCGLLANGQCLLAGTEWCDWDCGRLGLP